MDSNQTTASSWMLACTRSALPAEDARFKEFMAQERLEILL